MLDDKNNVIEEIKAKLIEKEKIIADFEREDKIGEIEK